MKFSPVCMLAVFLSAGLSLSAQDLETEGIFAEESVNVAKEIQGSVNLNLVPTAEKKAVGFTCIFEKTKPIDITVTTDKESRALPVRFFKMGHPWIGQTAGLNRGQDGITFNDLRIYTTGNVYLYLRYDEEELTDTIRKNILHCTSDFPSLSEWKFHFDFMTGNTGNTEMYVNGNYVGAVPGKLKSVQAKGDPGTYIVESGARRQDVFGPYHPVRFLDGFRESPLMRKTHLYKTKSGSQMIGNIPVHIMEPEFSYAVGQNAMCLGQYDVDKNPSTERHAFDALKGTMMFTVPQRLYTMAYVTCAVVPEKGKIPVLTLFQKRSGLGYPGSYGEGVAFDEITIPEKGPYPENIKEIGSVIVKDQDVPLLLVRMPLNPGPILDVIADDAPKKTGIGPFLEFEFLCKVSAVSKMPLKDRSSIHVFGITLEESPFKFNIIQSQAGNIFHNGQKAEFKLAVSGQGSGTVRCEIKNEDGKVMSDTTLPFDVKEKKGLELTIPLVDEKLDAWYSFVLEAKDKSGRQLFTHNGSYVTLGQDTREAEYDSPFGIWLMRGTHNTCSDKEKLRELCFKAGFRRVTNPPGDTEEELKPWKITRNQISHYGGGGLDWEHPEEYLIRYKKNIQDQLEKFPHAYSVLIFHEHGGEDTAQEMLGKPVQVDKNSKDEYTEIVKLLAPVVRKNFPNLKVQVGNSCTSGELIARLLRNGLDGNLIDCIGIETPGIVAIPEAKVGISSPAAGWATREVARKFGYDIPLNACFEYTFRQETYFGDPVQTTRYLVRDQLVGLALGFKTLNAGHLDDANNAYYNSSWGASGLLHRSPTLYPKRAYLAMAVLTKTLDKIEFLRRFDTMAASLYALEFKRNKKVQDFVYAFWTPRPDWAPFLTLKFPQGTQLKLISMYGKEQVLTPDEQGNVRFQVSHSPEYLIATKTAEKTVAMENQDDGVKRQMIDEWKTADNFTLVPDTLMKTLLRAPGEFTVSTVKDEKFGSAVSLVLKGNDKLPELVGETGAVKFKNKYLVPENAEEIGFWVKGNSSWGSISMWFADDKGKDYKVSVAPALTHLNFEGWYYFRTALSGNSIYPRLMKNLPSPLYLIGFQFEVPRMALNPGEMVNVSRELRFSGLSFR